MRIFLFALLGFVALSGCEERNEVVTPVESFEGLSKELGNIFRSEFRYVQKVSNTREALAIVDEWAEMLEKSQKNKGARTITSDQELFGFYASLQGDILEITPITAPVPNASCPDGYTDYGSCTNKACVIEKMTAAMADVEQNTSGCVDIRVIRNLFGVRVCGKKC